MTYISATMNHFRAVQQWAAREGAQANLDVTTFELKVSRDGAQCRMRPQFLASVGGRLAHVTSLAPTAVGLTGWLPYELPWRWARAADKVAFKTFLRVHGHKTPEWWPDPRQAQSDFIVKRPQGSFGYGIQGPFRAGYRWVPGQTGSSHPDTAPPPFAEQFVFGEIVKLWFWAGRPFFAHLERYPAVTGDGRRTLQQLIVDRLRLVDRILETAEERPTIEAVLAYQGLGMADVLQAGRQAWIDFRYGRRFRPSPATTQSDDVLDSLPAGALAQAEAVGSDIESALRQDGVGPVMYAVDAVLDQSGDLWWLEMNTNPMLPPEGYERMLGTLLLAEDGRG